MSDCLLDQPCETSLRTSVKREGSKIDTQCQFKRQRVQSQESQPSLQTHDGSIWELQEGETGHTLPEIVDDEKEGDTSSKEACFGMVNRSLSMHMEVC